MASHTVGLNFIASTGSAQSAINRLRQSISGISTTSAAASGGVLTLSGAIGMMVAAAAPVLVLTAAFVALKKTMDSVVANNMEFDKSMSALKGAVASAGDDIAGNIGALERRAREASKGTEFSWAQSTEALAELVKAGNSAKDSADMLSSSLTLSIVSGDNFSDSAKNLTNVMKAFGKEGKDSETVLDVFVATTRGSSSTFKEMSKVLTDAASKIGGMEQSFEDVSTGINFFIASGNTAKKAGKAYSEIMGELADSSSGTFEALKSLGLATEDIIPSATNSLVDIMRKAQNQGLTTANAYEIFGKKAGISANAFATLYNDINNFNGVLTNSEGIAKRAADSMGGDMGTSLKELKAAWSDLMVVLGSGTIWNSLIKLVQGTKDVLITLSTTVESLKASLASGDFGDIVWTSLKNAFMDSVNFLYTALQVTFVGSIELLKRLIMGIFDGGFQSSMFKLISALGSSVTGIVQSFAAALIEAIEPFLTPLLGGLIFISDKFVGSLLIGAAKFGNLILGAVTLALSKFRKIGEFLGLDVGKILDSLETGRKALQATEQVGKDTAGRGWDDARESAENIIIGSIEGLRGGADDQFEMADKWLKEGGEELGLFIKDGIIDPVSDAVQNTLDRDLKIFDNVDSKERINALLKSLYPEAGEIKQTEKGEGSGGTNETTTQGRTFAVSGAARQALNTIMGRTANEIIAEVVADQLKVSKDTRDEVRRTTEAVEQVGREIAQASQNNQTNYSTFQ